MYPLASHTRKRLFFQLLPVLLMGTGVFLGLSQLDKVRQFFGHASGNDAALVIDAQAVLGDLPRPWRNLAQGGEQHDWRLQPLIGQVKALHPTTIRLDHIYDFYDIVQGTPGNITFSFSKLDAVLDDIAATGAKPYISLSYMPPAISSGDIVAPPVRWEDWQLVVQKTIEHISGTRKTSDVYYEVWNEPDLFGDWKYYGTRNYLTLYKYAAKGAMNARGVQPFKIGGPATTALYKNWFDALATFVLEEKLRFDFFSWHRYTTSLDRYYQDMVEVNQWVQQYPQLEPILEFHITEWGHDSKNNAGYDSAFGAAHTVAAAIEMIGVIDHAFVFEIQDGKDPAGKSSWGRWGLFTHTSAGASAKPRYYGLRMLDRLAGQRVQLTGKGSWVKAVATQVAPNHHQLVLANFDPTGKNAEQVPVTFLHLQPGTYTIRQEFLGGQQFTQHVSTNDAEMLVFSVPMPAYAVAFVEVTPE